MEKSKYGVYFYNDEIFVENINSSTALSKYSYTAEINTVSSHNGNGTNNLTLFQNGKILPVVSGKWELKPIVVQSYNWSGYSYKMILTDPESIEKEYRFTFEYTSIFKKSGFDKDLKGIFSKMKDVEFLANHAHFNLLLEKQNLEKGREYNRKEIDKLKNEVERKNEHIKELEEEISKLKTN